MRLIDKKEVLIQKSQEKKREIDEGVKLAKSIDALRETHAKEQVSLKKFRDESFQVMKLEMEQQIIRKTQLTLEIEKLESERMRLHAPIDLIQEWERVKKFKSETTQLKDELDTREHILISKEITVTAKDKEQADKEQEIIEKDATSRRFLSETQLQYEMAEKTRNESEKLKSKVIQDSEKAEYAFREKEISLAIRERDLGNLQQKLENDQLEIDKEKIHIASQQQTLKVAWEALRKLKNKNG